MIETITYWLWISCLVLSSIALVLFAYLYFTGQLKLKEESLLLAWWNKELTFKQMWEEKQRIQRGERGRIKLLAHQRKCIETYGYPMDQYVLKKNQYVHRSVS